MDGESEHLMDLRCVMVGALVIAAVLLPACLELETTNGSGANGGTGGSGTGGTASVSSSGGASCATKTCEECTLCATQTPEGSCYAEFQACANSMECIVVNECIQACPPGNFSCWQSCFMMYPEGGNLFMDFDVCVYCMECDKPCADAQLCLD